MTRGSRTNAPDGTAATADRDDTAASGTLTSSPGQTSTAITVTIDGDKKRAPNEVFYVDLFGVSPDAAVGRSRGPGAILNDD